MRITEHEPVRVELAGQDNIYTVKFEACDASDACTDTATRTSGDEKWHAQFENAI